MHDNESLHIMRDIMRTFIPSTSFVSSPATEKERLLYMTASVASGFYPRHGFLILPNIPKYNYATVVIPEFVKEFSQKYWNDAKKAGNTMPLKLTDFMWKCVENINFSPVNTKNIERIAKDWKLVENDFWKFINDYFPQEIKWINSLEVRITRIGSFGSHYLLTKATNQKLIINIRSDADYVEIANLIILALIYPTSRDLDLSFGKRMAIRDFIETRKPIKKIFLDWKHRNYDNIKMPINLRKESDKYIQKLGVPNLIDPILVISKNRDNFGIKEGKLLELMMKNKNELINYDQIADCIWGEGSFKSYWAISKIIQRIIIKINNLKIDGIKIIGIRGKGYKLEV